MPLDIDPLNIYRNGVWKYAVLGENVTDQQNAPLLSLQFYSVFHNIFCLYMFLTGGFIFRPSAVATTGTVQYMSTCAVHPGSSYYGSATVEAVLCGPGSSVGIATD